MHLEFQNTSQNSKHVSEFKNTCQNLKHVPESKNTCQNPKHVPESKNTCQNPKQVPAWDNSWHFATPPICALVSQTSFRRETSGSIANCRLFSQAKHNPESKKHQGCLWILGCGFGFGEVFLGSETCFGFCEVFLDSGKCFWILGRVLDSGKCFWILGSVFGFWDVF